MDSPEEVDERREIGLRRAQQFTWEAAAARLHALYEKAAEA
jgi:hypothetical protein